MLVRCIFFVLVCVVAGTAPLGAQNFQGRGPEATDTFSLGAGQAVFDVQYKGEGSFAVNLLDDGGTLIGELASGSGAFSGSKAVRIERTGLYRIDIAATGEWSVRLRRNEVATVATAVSPELERGRTEGTTEASRISTTGWLARGFIGGALLGPIGTGVAVAKAASSAAGTAAQAAQAQSFGNMDYARSWESAYLDRLRMKRQRSALIGGAVGSGVLLFALLQVIDLGGVTEEDEVGEPSVPIVIPIRW
jgi:hypothetical protein